MMTVALPQPDALSSVQQQIAHAPASGEIVIGGVAGSGKTVAALHRAAHVAWDSDPRDRGPGVLFLCFNRTLEAAIRALLAGFPSDVVERVEVSTAHSWCWRAYLRKPYGSYATVATTSDRLAVVREAIHETRRHLGDRDILRRDPGTFLEEIRLIKGGDVVDPAAYRAHAVARGGRLAAADYHTIFAVAQTYNQLLWASGRLDYDDYAVLAREQRTLQRRPRGYDHVIVDEAQDLSAAQVELAREVARRSLLIIADQQQAIYRVTQLPDTLPPAAYTHVLPESFRTTRPIFELARKLLPAAAGYTPPRRTGARPRYQHFRWTEEEADFIGTTIDELLRRGYTAPEIAVLAPTHALLAPIAAALDDRHLPVADAATQPSRPGIHLTTIHAAKGREFRAVLITGLVEGVLPCIWPELDQAAAEREVALARRLLYVAMTRARDELWLLGSEGRPSRLLHELGLVAITDVGTPS